MTRLIRTLPAPLVGPAFGSYRPDEVSWLLKDLSAVSLEADTASREQRIQSGRAHYAESLPIEFQPDEAYQQLFATVLADSAARLASAVGLVTDLVLAERGDDVTLVSLARAGTPVGILMKRWAAHRHGLDLPHYAISIVRGRGIDEVALDYLARHHDPASVVFVDGWTGKGAIARELHAAVVGIAAAGGPVFDPALAVLADPGSCVSHYGTRDDFLIASACLNSTVSGLVSRTVLNDAYIGPDDFHGAKFYAELAAGRPLERAAGRGHRTVRRGDVRRRRRAAGPAGGRPVTDLGRLDGGGGDPAPLRRLVGELRQARRGGDDPGAAAPHTRPGARPRPRQPRPRPHPAARRPTWRSGRGGA